MNMQSLTVKFSNVGRGRRSWTATLVSGPTTADREYAIAREAKRNGGLASRGVDAVFDDGSVSEGGILVGGFRMVGRFAVLPEPQQEASG